MYRRERINERDVPESKHTIFIRGLPGTMTTEEIRGFFEKHGDCTFDFVKVSPDRSKLYVAVRFDSKTVAKDVMDKYGTEGKILGYDVELTWFRDIRRYLAHVASKQGVRPRFRRRDDFRGGVRERSKSPIRNRTSRSATNSRSPSQRSHSRTRSRSSPRGEGEENRSRSRSPTRSVASERSRSMSFSKSRSPSSPHSSPHSPQKSLDYSDMIKKERELSPTPPPKKSKKKKERKDRKKRKHISRSPSTGRGSEASDGEIISYQEQQKPQAYLQQNPPQQPQQQVPMTMTSAKPIGPQKPPEVSPQIYQPFAHRHLPVGSVAASQQSAHESPTKGQTQQQQQQPDSSSGYGQLHQHLQQQQNMFRQTFIVDLDQRTSTVQKFKQPIVDSTPQPGIVYQSVNGTKIDGNAKRPRLESSPSSTAVQNVKGPAANDLLNASPIRQGGPLATNVFKEIQRHILQDVRYKAQETEEEGLGGLRLSSLSKQRMTDDMRDEKVAKLSQELRDRVNKKKRQLELSYRHDCETFGLVTRKLIEKDRTLEDRLKIALLETMKELEEETMKQLDEFLDQLSFICA